MCDFVCSTKLRAKSSLHWSVIHNQVIFEGHPGHGLETSFVVNCRINFTFCCQDFSYTSRESLRDMLCEMKLATKECLNACVFSLLDNLKRYPEDRVSIWKYVQGFS